jgi:hypothetical protein
MRKAIRGHQVMRKEIRGHQVMRKAIRGHQVMRKEIRGHQWSSEVIRCRLVEQVGQAWTSRGSMSVVLSGHQRSSVVISGDQW